MRLTYQDGVFYCSFTDDEYNSMEKHKPLVLDNGSIKVLHDDMTDVLTSVFKESMHKIAELQSQISSGKK
tara:strand:+ start:26 stop:235 length:210 start_codon:yes stop_codon:yes gene_type:complete